MTRRRLAEAPRVTAVTLSNQARVRVTVDAAEPWYRITNHGDGDPVVDIYGEIGWEVWADEFAADLRAIDAPQITVKISSPGGSVFEGLVIYNAILDHPATVNVVVDSMAASAASFIAQAGDHVLMNRGAQMMIHDAIGSVWGGNAADMEDMRALLDKISNEIAGVYAARAGGTVAEWRTRMLAETWMTGSEAVELGLADEAAATARRGSTDDATTDDSVESPAARLMSGFRSPVRDQLEPAPLDAVTDPVVDAPASEEPVVPAEPDPPAAAAVDAGFTPEAVITAVTDDGGPPGEAQEPAPEPAPDPPTEQPETEAPVTDDWGFVVARLTTPPSADDQWNRLKEALL